MVMSQCGNKPEAQKVIKEELLKYNDVIQRAKRASPKKDRMGYVCCNYFNMLSSIEKRTTGICPEKDVTTIIDFIKNIVQSFVDLSCGDYVEHSSSCDKLTKLPKKAKTDKKYETFILPLIELFDYLDRD